MIFDQRYRNRYPFAGLPPRQPLPGSLVQVGSADSADTIAELAGRSVFPRGQLVATVEPIQRFRPLPAVTTTSAAATAPTTGTTAIRATAEPESR